MVFTTVLDSSNHGQYVNEVYVSHRRFGTDLHELTVNSAQTNWQTNTINSLTSDGTQVSQ